MPALLRVAVSSGNMDALPAPIAEAMSLDLLELSGRVAVGGVHATHCSALVSSTASAAYPLRRLIHPRALDSLICAPDQRLVMMMKASPGDKQISQRPKHLDNLRTAST
jgi:hypothetical protein